MATINIQKVKMLRNLQVKLFLSRIANGTYVSNQEVLPAYPTLDVAEATVSAKTSNYTVTEADLDAPTIFNNTGASGNVTLTLPAVADSVGKVVRAHAKAAQTIRFAPQTGEAINYNGDAVAGKYVQLAGTAGGCLELFCNGEQWVVSRPNGVVTKEA